MPGPFEIRASGVSPTVTGCTFSGNSGELYGGGMDNSSSSPTVTNCILWANGLNAIVGGMPVVSNTDVQGGFPGTGNIDTDPLFVDAVAGNFRLSPGSLCIDSGANNANATTTDLEGYPRFVDDPATPDCPEDVNCDARLIPSQPAA